MKIALWIAQSILALAFIGAGAMKLMSAYDELALEMAWVGRWSPQMVMLIGLVEVLGAIGVLLPSLLRIQPKLSPIAALGLLVVMVLALIDHIGAGEMDMLVGPVVLGALSAFVAWGRWTKLPIVAK